MINYLLKTSNFDNSTVHRLQDVRVLLFIWGLNGDQLLLFIWGLKGGDQPLEGCKMVGKKHASKGCQNVL
jgi:hypothetical protein